MPNDFYDLIKSLVAEKEMADVIFTDSKLERGAKLEKLINDVKEKFNQDETLVEKNTEWEKLLPEAIFKYEKEVLRKSILNEGKRPDGRKE